MLKLVSIALLGTALAHSADSKAKPPNPNAVLPPTVDSLAAQVKVQAKFIEALQKQVAELKGSVDLLHQGAAYQSGQIFHLQHESAEFDPSDPNHYFRVETEIGPLLVSLGKVEPYLDGYKVQLRIGHLLFVTLQGAKISAKWNRRQKSGDTWEWLKSERSKEFSITDAILPNRWNPVELIFPNTKPDGFGYLSISVSVNTVSLNGGQ